MMQPEIISITKLQHHERNVKNYYVRVVPVGRDGMGPRRTVPCLVVGAQEWVCLKKKAFFPSVSISALFIPQISIKSREASIFLSFFNDSFLLALVFLPNVVANLVAKLG